MYGIIVLFILPLYLRALLFVIVESYHFLIKVKRTYRVKFYKVSHRIPSHRVTHHRIPNVYGGVNRIRCFRMHGPHMIWNHHLNKSMSFHLKNQYHNIMKWLENRTYSTINIWTKLRRRRISKRENPISTDRVTIEKLKTTVGEWNLIRWMICKHFFSF